MATVRFQVRRDGVTGERLPSLHHLTGQDSTLTLCGKRLRGWSWQSKQGEVTCPTCAKGVQQPYGRR